jgi:hypothetical protein
MGFLEILPMFLERQEMQFVMKFIHCDASDRYSTFCMCCYEHVAPYIRYNPKFLWFVTISETWISS